MMREIFKANWKLFVSALFGLLAGAALGGASTLQPGPVSAGTVRVQTGR